MATPKRISYISQRPHHRKVLKTNPLRCHRRGIRPTTYSDKFCIETKSNFLKNNDCYLSQHMLLYRYHLDCQALLLYKNNTYLVRVEGFEPSIPFGRQILSLLCIPFHHTRMEHRVGLEPTTLRICNPLHWPLCHLCILVL
jgi:hypothetical protein